MFPSFCLISFPLSLISFLVSFCNFFFLFSILYSFLSPVSFSHSLFYFSFLVLFFLSFFFYPSPPLLVFVFTCLSVTLLNPDSQIGRFLSCGLNGKCVCVRIWLPADSSSVVLVLCFLLNLPFLSFFRKCC